MMEGERIRVLSLYLAILFVCMACAPPSILLDNQPLGDAGRLYIPSVNISVRVYDSPATGKVAQQLVDNWDSAAWCKSFKGGCGYIADHWNHAFGALKYCVEGDMAYIKTDAAIEAYQCVKVVVGDNKGKFLITDEGERLEDIQWADFCAYTCKNGWQEIYMAFFKRIDT